MVDVNTQNKTISVNVSSSGVSSNVNASGDTTLYYSNKAREWATSNRIVDNTDYSSKYYANKSQESATLAQTSATNASETYTQLQATASQTLEDLATTANTALENISNTEETSISNINTVKDEGLTEIETTKTTAVNTVNTTKDNAITQITQEGAEQVANIERTGFYMRDDKLYFINSEGEEEEFKSGGGGLEIGDIGIAPLGIDETLGKRRYLNGQIIIQDQYQVFADKVKSAIVLYPNLACSEEDWQATVTLSAFGQCGKFVVDDTAGTIRLPKITGFIQGLNDLASLGSLVEAGLPNITGAFHSPKQTSANGAWQSGAFLTNSATGESNAIFGTSGDATQRLVVDFNASRSSSIYGNSNTVQPESTRYPYFIQVATGSETEVDIVNEIELNNPYSLLDVKWSDKLLNNISWLRSEGQPNSKAIYNDAYDLILREYNNPIETKIYNFNTVGSLVNNDGVLSGFSTSNYAQIPNSVSLGSNFEVQVKATTGSDVSSQQKIIMGKGEQYFVIGTNEDGAFDFNIGNGTQWLNPTNTLQTLSANTTYWFKVTFNGSRYSCLYSTNGETFTEGGYLESSTTIPTHLLQLGIGRTTVSPWLGSIDLNESYININGERWWTGVTYEPDQTETVGGTTITFRRGSETNIKVTTDKSAYDSILSATGTAWYYVLDTANENFYLPQTDGFLQFGGDGNFVEAGLPNITGSFSYDVWAGGASGAFYRNGGNRRAGTGGDNNSPGGTTSLNASRSSSIYGNSDTVQPNAVQGYLYFYVGETIQNASLINAGRIEEKLADKADKSELQPLKTAYITETYKNGTSWYRVYSDGWCEQGGYQSSQSGTTGVAVTFLKEFSNTNYCVIATVTSEAGYMVGCLNKTTKSFLWRSMRQDGQGLDRAGNWRASGYIS